jgi:hypothetical protein
MSAVPGVILGAREKKGAEGDSERNETTRSNCGSLVQDGSRRDHAPGHPQGVGDEVKEITEGFAVRKNFLIALAPGRMRGPDLF